LGIFYDPFGIYYVYLLGIFYGYLVCLW
jgi:hypothetical protein